MNLCEYRKPWSQAIYIRYIYSLARTLQVCITFSTPRKNVGSRTEGGSPISLFHYRQPQKRALLNTTYFNIIGAFRQTRPKGHLCSPSTRSTHLVRWASLARGGFQPAPRCFRGMFVVCDNLNPSDTGDAVVPTKRFFRCKTNTRFRTEHNQVYRGGVRNTNPPATTQIATLS